MTSVPLSVSHPDIAAEAAGWDPSTTSKGSNIKRRWRCAQGHEWEATANNRTKGTGCPVCSGRKLVLGVNDLATKHPELAAEACGWDPTAVLAGSHQSRQWRCALGHESEATLSDRAKGTGCPYCAGVRAWPGFNDLATTHPELADEAVGWDPATVLSGSNARLAWRCDLGHEWLARVSHRAGGSGCPVCTNKVVLAGFNDLTTTHPLLASEADGWDPATVQPGTTRRVSWCCAEGHRWTAKVYTRTSMGTGCPVCAGRAPDVGVNDLATTHPDLAAQAVDWDPRRVKAASNLRVAWRCDAGHEWEAIVFSRECAPRDLNPKPAD